MDQAERVDPMIYVFPRMTKCTFHKFGPSGTLERHDAFCLLPLNILNEKVYYRCVSICYRLVPFPSIILDTLWNT